MLTCMNESIRMKRLECHAGFILMLALRYINSHYFTWLLHKQKCAVHSVRKLQDPWQAALSTFALRQAVPASQSFAPSLALPGCSTDSP